MANTGINFAHQTSLYKEKEKKEALLKGAVVAIFILVLTVIVYGGVFVYQVSQKLELSKVQEAIQREQSSRNYNELTEALDTASRLNFSSEMSRRQILWSGILSEIQSLMLPSVHVEKIKGMTDFSLESQQSNTPAPYLGLVMTDDEMNSVKVDIISQNLSDIAKQIVAFSESERFSDVVIGSSSGSGAELEEEGIAVTLQLRLAEHALERGTFPIESFSDISPVAEPESETEESFETN